MIRPEGPLVRMIRRIAGVLLGLLAALAATVGVAHAQPGGNQVQVRTVPAIPGVPINADGASAKTDGDGNTRLPVRQQRGLDERLEVPLTDITPDLRVERDRVIGVRSPDGVTVGLRLQRLVQYRFAGPNSEAIAHDRITRLALRSNTGESVVLEGADVGKPLWLAASRTQQTPNGLVSKDLYWTISHVVVDGAEVVNKGQQKFVPNQERDWTVKLLFYQVRAIGKDAIFGSPAGEGIELHRPDGTLLRAEFSPEGIVDLHNVPRGDYDVRVYGSGLSFIRPVGISKDQELELEVITPLDLWLVGSGLLLLAVGLVAVGRRARLRELANRPRFKYATSRLRRPVDLVGGRPRLQRALAGLRRPASAVRRRIRALIPSLFRTGVVAVVAASGFLALIPPPGGRGPAVPDRPAKAGRILRHPALRVLLHLVQSRLLGSGQA